LLGKGGKGEEVLRLDAGGGRARELCGGKKEGGKCPYLYTGGRKGEGVYIDPAMKNLEAVILIEGEEKGKNGTSALIVFA